MKHGNDFICSVTVQNRQYFLHQKIKSQKTTTKMNYTIINGVLIAPSYPYKLVYSFQHGMSQKHFTFAFLFQYAFVSKSFICKSFITLTPKSITSNIHSFFMCSSCLSILFH